MTFAKTIELILSIALLCAAIFLVLQISQASRKISADCERLIDTAQSATANIRDAAAAARDASREAAGAAAEQRAYWNKTALETYKTTAAARLLIVRADRSLNDELEPRMATVLDDTHRLSSQTADELASAIEDLRPTFRHLGEASGAAAAAMSDPHIAETLAEADRATASAASAADRTAQTAAHLDDAARDFAAYVHRMTAPTRGVWQALRYLLGLASDAGNASKL